MASQDSDGNDVLVLNSVYFPLVQGDSDGETFGQEDYSGMLEGNRVIYQQDGPFSLFESPTPT
jgi:hypothetical protein